MSKTIIVSNRLPISINKTDEGLEYKPSAGGLATGLGSIYKEGENIWLGWPGTFFKTEEAEESVTKELAKESMRPVFLTEKDIEHYYEGYSNSIIWPLFHYFTQYCEFKQEDWDSYKEVNQKFCDAILKYAEDGDFIWVHDYQLMLLPQMLREKLPNASIGYFNHIPFPSYEIFRCLPWRESTLRGLLGADMIGFHTYDDMRHFLSAVSRIEGIEHEMGHLRAHDRIITVDALPMGIDYEKYSSAVVSSATQKEAKRFMSSINTERFILSIDRLDYSKGIPQRLEGYAAFLEKYPEYQKKVSLILLVVPSREHVETYKELKEELELLVGRINGKYSDLGWTPIHYFYRSLPFNQLSALYSLADVAMVTPLRDGMNLVCKEYIASRLDKTGVLILSEMAGAAKELTEAVIINPNDQLEIVEGLKEALTMPEEEQIVRNTEMQKKLKKYDIHHWVDMFMDRVDYTKNEQKKLQERNLSIGNENKLIDAFKSSKRRLFLLDYDGTLQHFHENPQSANPDKELLGIMKKLTADKQNRVVVISGRDRQTLQKWLGHFDVEFVAEHGVWHKDRDSEWDQVANLRDDWKPEIRTILELYVSRTPGSMIEEKDYSLVWHYRKADQGLGDLRSRELISNLQYLTGNMDIHIMEGNKVIEIKNAGVNKGNGALKWLGKEDFDFVFTAGDDRTDEDTFDVMPSTAYSIKVGDGNSKARYNVKGVDDIRRILTSFVK